LPERCQMFPEQREESDLDEPSPTDGESDGTPRYPAEAEDPKVR
jgi:hypothetical protein